MAYIELFVLITILCVVFYKWSVATYDQLKERGVPHEPPLPLVGNTAFGVILGRKSFMEEIIRQYQKFPNSKVYGGYDFRKPVIVLRDCESIKKITIKDFDNFMNHKTFRDDFPESIIMKTLMAMTDRKWKEMRNTLTPSFTGSKMRLMFGLINECCLEGAKYIEEEIKSSGKNELHMNMKDYFTRFTNDAIATSAFGIKVNSFKDKQNQFYTMCSAMTNFKGLNLIRIFAAMLIPQVLKYFCEDIIDAKYLKYFRALVIDAIKYRKTHNVLRPDMIQLLIEATNRYENLDEETKAAHPDFNDSDVLVAQCFIFLLAGFASVSTCLCFTTHELLWNADVQERLYEEIKETENELGGKPLDYETLMKMKYLDMVISESLRLWPPSIVADRMCAADYKLTDEDGNLIVEIKKGENVIIPIIGLHRDPQYYAEPDKFNPERFSEENKKDIPPMAYLPFGHGPRNCIGNRLALMETKALLYHLVLNFRIESTPKTVKNLLKESRGIDLEPKQGFWAKFTRRNYH